MNYAFKRTKRMLAFILALVMSFSIFVVPASADAKLGNAEFTSRAPAPIVQQQRDTRATLEQKITLLRESLATLG